MFVDRHKAVIGSLIFSLLFSYSVFNNSVTHQGYNYIQLGVKRASKKSICKKHSIL